MQKSFICFACSDNFWDIVSFSCEPLPAVAEALNYLLIESDKFTDQGVCNPKGACSLKEGVFPLHFIHVRCDGKTVVIDEFREAFDSFRIQIDRPRQLNSIKVTLPRNTLPASVSGQ